MRRSSVENVDCRSDFLAVTAWAQEPTAIPVDQEPHHKVVLKNDFVWVIDATFPAGYVTLNHSHEIDNVAVTISTGREAQNKPPE